jgi:hypothetical protein
MRVSVVLINFDGIPDAEEPGSALHRRFLSPEPTRSNLMRTTLKMAAVTGILAVGVFLVGLTSAHAGCGGGGGGYYRGGGYGGGHTFGSYGGGYGGGSGCGGCGMMMGGMSMGGMQMPVTQTAAMSMPGMNMGGYAAPPVPAPAPAPAPVPAPAAATAQYHCPMHPSVVASFPAKCPYCGMTLTR